MNLLHISRQLKMAALAFICLGLILLLAVAAYVPLNASFTSAFADRDLVKADLVKPVLKATATMFFVLFPIIVIMLNAAGVAMLYYSRILRRQAQATTSVSVQ